MFSYIALCTVSIGIRSPFQHHRVRCFVPIILRKMPVWHLCFPMYSDTDGSHLLPQSVGDYTGEDIFLCYTHCLVTVIGKDHDSLSSWWTFNEALFMLQPRRERAEKCQAGPSRRAVWGWKHFEVRERLRGLITRLCCHSRQPANQSEKKSKAKPGFTFPTPPHPPKAFRISGKHLFVCWLLNVLFFFFSSEHTDHPLCHVLPVLYYFLLFIASCAIVLSF